MKKGYITSVLLSILFLFVSVTANASEGHGESDLDVGSMIMHHITDANEFHVFGNVSVPLPCIVFHKEHGFDFFMSSAFHHGHTSHNGYVMSHGRLNYVDVPNFPKTPTEVSFTKDKDGQEQVVANGTTYPISRAGFYDFSITKVVFTMLLTLLIMLFIFPKVARAYSKKGAPNGLQSFIEVLVVFVRDEIAKPNLGSKTNKYLPYLLTLFFFIWINNLIGLIPFFPGSGNATGNISVTLTLAAFTLLVVNFSGNKHYWGHIFNPPGVPVFVKPILIVIEFLSIFIKPFALMLRLFANITAGHIIILSLVGIIFIFANALGSGAGYGASIISSLFILFMNVLELFVAALQAYIFTVLTAVFLGQAVEEHHHEHEEAHH